MVVEFFLPEVFAFYSGLLVDYGELCWVFTADCWRIMENYVADELESLASFASFLRTSLAGAR